MFRQIRNFSKPCPRPKSMCPDPKPSKKKPSKRKRAPSECIVGPSGVYPPHEGGYKMWRNMALFVCLPMIAFATQNTFCNFDPPERPKFIPLEYMRRRTRQFCWGENGPTDKSFFHNPHVNALSNGYEDVHEEK